MTPLALAIIGTAFFFGGMIKGATGVGAPFLTIPAITAAVGIRHAIIIMLIPTIVTNIWQSFAFRHETRTLAFLAPMVWMAVIGMIVGTLALAVAPTYLLSLVLLGLLVSYIVMRVARPHWSLSAERGRRLAMPAGLLSGLAQGAAGLSGPIALPFISSMKLTRPQFAGSVSLLFLSTTTTQAVALWWTGLLEWDLLVWSAAALGPMVLGMAFGAWAARRVAPNVFQNLILGVLIGLAIKLGVDVAGGLGG